MPAKIPEVTGMAGTPETKEIDENKGKKHMKNTQRNKEISQENHLKLIRDRKSTSDGEGTEGQM